MFFYSLPLIFTYTNFGNPFELAGIALVLFVALSISAPFENQAFENKPLNFPLYYYFFYAWTAQLSLPQVFWPFFLLLNAGIYAADYAAKAGELTVSSWDNFYIMFFFPCIWWSFAVWRSSENTSSKVFAAFARLMTLAVFFEYGLKFFIRSQYPKIFFECQEKLMDYMMCF